MQLVLDNLLIKQRHYYAGIQVIFMLSMSGDQYKAGLTTLLAQNNYQVDRRYVRLGLGKDDRRLRDDL